MSHAKCTDTPVSWLLLEQYNLGELSGQEQRDVESHVNSCGACDRHLQQIVDDEYVLKPLPDIETQRSLARAFELVVNFVLRPVPIAAAAVTLLLMLMVPHWTARDTATDPGYPAAMLSHKGGDLAVSLVRERGGAVIESPNTFANNDRFSVRVTCPMAGNVPYDVVVFQGEDISFPYETLMPLQCGNLVPIKGAFTLSGNTPATVCVIFDHPPSRTAIRQDRQRALPASTVCTTVTPVAPVVAPVSK